ncbi:hypothetical protein [Nitrospina watsonii]|uniref:Lipoprotein n=1 Tax=Nitrospina watsonii TaxID=1323948 RepID=A0ABN8VZT1_9BACT|nr:hypothetical protein [Nitrospina watsonii]CAI2719292.1 conserved exported protein of unknown function [Nitrospina watsonii]
MTKIFLPIGLAMMLSLGACTHFESTTHKRWTEHRNTIFLNHITETQGTLADPGMQLKLALEDEFRNSLYIVAIDPEDARWELKFQIDRYTAGSRLKRFFTFGISDAAEARLVVKVALMGKQGMLGAWEIHTRVEGGLLGGSEHQLYEMAAKQIRQHLRGY